ncbi:MAG TPA: hypothetical protein VMV95_01810 [Bacillota bacterium]|nr:hypothetical protein [Bacillota bacterium]
MGFSQNYLEKLAKISIPKWKTGMGSDGRNEELYNYAQVRNSAKYLLKYPDKEIENKLSELVEKLEIKI